jgi:hypothetical protein
MIGELAYEKRDAMTTIEVLDPAGPVQSVAELRLNLLGELAGRRLAVLDNSKPNFQRLATLVGERLRAERALASVVCFRKENPAVGASTELLDQIAQSADLVLTGSAD